MSRHGRRHSVTWAPSIARGARLPRPKTRRNGPRRTRTRQVSRPSFRPAAPAEAVGPHQNMGAPDPYSFRTARVALLPQKDDSWARRRVETSRCRCFPRRRRLEPVDLARDQAIPTAHEAAETRHGPGVVVDFQQGVRGQAHGRNKRMLGRPGFPMAFVIVIIAGGRT